MKRSDEFMPDEQIIELYWQRDETAIARTAEKYGRLVYKIAFNILNDDADSQECQNDSYLRLWNAMPPSRPRVLQSFIARVTRNLALDKLRRLKSQKRIESEFTVSLDELSEALPDPASERDADELAESISGFVRELPARRRYVFVGRYYFALPISDIAKELGIGDSAVYKEIAKLKCELRAYLEKEGVYI